MIVPCPIRQVNFQFGVVVVRGLVVKADSCCARGEGVAHLIALPCFVLCRLLRYIDRQTANGLLVAQTYRTLLICIHCSVFTLRLSMLGDVFLDYSSKLVAQTYRTLLICIHCSVFTLRLSMLGDVFLDYSSK